MNARSLTPNWVETFHDLQSASTVEGLWGVLLAQHGIRSSSAWEEPYRLFMRFHRHDSTNAEVTAALLCNDYRWRNATRHLVDRVVASGVLDHERLDALADWFGGEACEISIETPDAQGPDGAAKVRRPIWPPLRRWAGRHQIERHPERWRDVIDASTALSSRDAAATVAGVMHAADHVLPDDRPGPRPDRRRSWVRHGSPRRASDTGLDRRRPGRDLRGPARSVHQGACMDAADFHIWLGSQRARSARILGH
jgi:hypothetical protein